MATIKFYGDLTQFGSEFKMQVKTASEALRGLMIQIKGLREHIQKGAYYIKINHKNINLKELKTSFKHQLNSESIVEIIPEINGSGRGVGQLILGSIMLVVGVALFATGVGASFAPSLIAGGVGMMLGGITQMLTRPPEMDNKQVEASKSTAFSNISNQDGFGSCIPMAYGRLAIGSKTISQSIESYNTKTVKAVDKK